MRILSIESRERIHEARTKPDIHNVIELLKERKLNKKRLHFQSSFSRTRKLRTLKTDLRHETKSIFK